MMGKFMDECKDVIGGVVNSKLELYVTQRLQNEKTEITSDDGTPLRTLKLVRDAWNFSVPSEKFAGQVYDLVFVALGDNRGALEWIVFDTCMTLKIWFPLDNEAYINRGKGSVAMSTIVMALLREKVNDNIRKKIYGNAPHNIKLTISETGRKGRRKKNQFVYSDNVSGFHSKKHIEWQSKQVGPPSIQKDVSAMSFSVSHPSAAKNNLLEPHSTATKHTSKDDAPADKVAHASDSFTSIITVADYLLSANDDGEISRPFSPIGTGASGTFYPTYRQMGQPFGVQASYAHVSDDFQLPQMTEDACRQVMFLALL